MKNLVSVEWLQDHLNDKNLVLLNASLAKPAQVDDAPATNQPMIPNTRLFDLKGKFADKTSSFPNTVPTPTQFEQECQNLGINQNSKIVVFDTRGIYASPRAWWLFKVMGHQDVMVLDGGLPEWIKRGFETSPQIDKDYPKGDFKASFNNNLVKTYNDVVKNVEASQFTIMDARSQGRFNGTEQEPRKWLQSGHIPQSVSLPYSFVLKDGKMKSKTELQEFFTAVKGKDLVFSCGSGITACIIMLAHAVAHQESLYLYDGSWSEWAELQNLKTAL
ncbi:MAG: sulfurtransferase [Saprospiraceae bacterium]|nr:sulfurtransferase [Saprospiraceae bacterium]